MSFLEKSLWLKDRFQSMESAEVISRIADAGRHLALRATLLPLLQGHSAGRIDNHDHSYKPPDISNQLGRVSERVRQAVITAADSWLKHRASFFSLNHTDLGESINWHQDYSSGLIAPLKYSAFINHRDITRVGDVKYVWELNRLQHLIPIALAWRWTGNTSYLTEIQKQVLSWHTSNPFMMGLNWKSPLEAGLRLISWAYVYFLISNLPQAVEVYLKVLRQTIYQHQYFIRNFYSKYSSANNHLIGEMAGLYVASIFWPWYRQSASWQSFSRQTLCDEIERQVEPDGVAGERAIEYQMFILELFLVAGALGQAAGDPFPDQYWHRLRSMLSFLSSISNRAGDIPVFGDGDSGHVVAVPETRAERTFGVGNFTHSCVPAESSILRSVLLLWGQAPHNIPIARIPKSDQSFQAFSNGGYYVLAVNRDREDEIVIVFDAGPLGLEPLNAHGHADALSFWFSYAGREFLIDPGTYSYYGSSLWRSYFRGTAAHNTVRVDRQDQSIQAGPFLWRQAAIAQLEQIRDTPEMAEVIGSHDGYCRLPDPVFHTRRLCLVKKSRSLAITDRLKCQRSHDIELFFHFSEKSHVRQVASSAFEATNGNKRLCVHLDSRLSPELYRGSENPIFGWVSRTFGVKEPSFSLVARAVIKESTEFVTEISAI